MESPWPTGLGLEAPDFENLNYAIALVNFCLGVGTHKCKVRFICLIVGYTIVFMYMNRLLYAHD